MLSSTSRIFVWSLNSSQESCIFTTIWMLSLHQNSITRSSILNLLVPWTWPFVHKHLSLTKLAQLLLTSVRLGLSFFSQWTYNMMFLIFHFFYWYFTVQSVSFGTWLHVQLWYLCSKHRACFVIYSSSSCIVDVHEL